MIKPADAQTVANFAASSGRERDFGTGKTVVNVVDIYVSPYGTYKTVLNRHHAHFSCVSNGPNLRP